MYGQVPEAMILLICGLIRRAIFFATATMSESRLRPMLRKLNIQIHAHGPLKLG